MQNVLAFFGAFNPPTRAHIDLAHHAMEQLGLDKVLFVPSKAAYIRNDQGKSFAFSDEQRLAMLRAAAESRPWMLVTDREMKADAQPRTYTTLCALRDEGVQAMLLMGSDKLPELEKGWLCVEEIAREFGIACMARGTDSCEELIRNSAFLSALAPYIRLIPTPDSLRGVSSTAVRRLVQQRAGRDELAAMVPQEILPFLACHHEGGNSHEA